MELNGGMEWWNGMEWNDHAHKMHFCEVAITLSIPIKLCMWVRTRPSLSLQFSLPDQTIRLHECLATHELGLASQTTPRGVVYIICITSASAGEGSSLVHGTIDRSLCVNIRSCHSCSIIVDSCFGALTADRS